MDHSGPTASDSPVDLVKSTKNDKDGDYNGAAVGKLPTSTSNQPLIQECRVQILDRTTLSSVSESSIRKCYRYGWCCFTPSILQPLFNNAKAFLIFVTISNIVQGILVNGLVKVNVTSIERRFQLLSSESGLIISSYDIAGCLCLLPISYIGGQRHKPRWISVGVLLLGIGSIILALPNFIVGPYQYKPSSTDDGIDVCVQRSGNNFSFNNNTSDDCSLGSVDYVDFRYMKYVFIIGQFVIGIGSSPLSILAVTMIDESVNEEVYPIHIGIFYLGALLGPAIGFILGGKLLTIFTNVYEIPSDINPESPTWVGAWWIGFLISGALAFLLSVPLFGYPSRLRKSSGGMRCSGRRSRKIEHDIDMKDLGVSNVDVDKHISESDLQTGSPGHTTDGSSEKNSLHTAFSKTSSARAIKEFWRFLLNSIVCYWQIVVLMWFRCADQLDLFQVLSNKAFMFLSLSAAIFSTLVSGFSTFGPKFIESQLGKSAADAANLFGYVCIPAGASGMLIGAFLMVGLKMNHKATLQMCIAVSAVSLLAHFVLVLDCNDPEIAGVTVPYRHNNSLESALNSVTVLDSCNVECNCHDASRFSPVCGKDLITYYSPCHAGCAGFDSTSNMYSDCACMTPGFSEVTAGICPKVCQWETLILFSLFVIILSTFMCTIPGVDISLRCFPNHQRSLAIGVQWILIRTLGTIPGPILFGAVIDDACLLVDKANCAFNGSCVLYKNSDLSFSFLMLSIAYKVAGIVTLSFALFYVKSCVSVHGSSQSSDPIQIEATPRDHAGHEQSVPLDVASRD